LSNEKKLIFANHWHEKISHKTRTVSFKKEKGTTRTERGGGRISMGGKSPAGGGEKTGRKSEEREVGSGMGPQGRAKSHEGDGGNEARRVSKEREAQTKGVSENCKTHPGG